jgi:hypothetical protein
VVENFLKLGGGSDILTRCQVRLAAYIHMVRAAPQQIPFSSGTSDTD